MLRQYRFKVLLIVIIISVVLLPFIFVSSKLSSLEKEVVVYLMEQRGYGEEEISETVAIEKGHIPEIKVTKAAGMRYGFADFASAGVVEETVQLPRGFWRLTDKEQFKWLDDQIGGTRKGMTWHHTEVPGKMELVPFGIHNITPHNGGRTKGMWADAPR